MNKTIPQNSNYKFLAFSKAGINKLLELTTKKQGTKSKKISPFTSADINILFYILDNLNYENTATIETQKEIQGTLGLSQKQISQTITKLINNNIMVKIDKARTYYINPNYFYLGTDRKNKIIQWKALTK